MLASLKITTVRMAGRAEIWGPFFGLQTLHQVLLNLESVGIAV